MPPKKNKLKKLCAIKNCSSASCPFQHKDQDACVTNFKNPPALKKQTYSGAMPAAVQW